MRDEHDFEVSSARDWLGLEDERPLTFGDYAWMAVQLAAVALFVVGGCVLAGIKTGVI